ncbi:hypothetical protein JXA56_02275 [Candidatus Micrarchaeota archaeon]|nr:hypothetical protein [Candidatus Micrarchaeota archaeon]
MSRGQVATEFMVYTAVFMFVAIAAFLIVNQLQTNEIPLQQNKVAREIGEGFATVTTLSVKGGEGFSYKYGVQRTIFNIPYTVHFLESNVIILEWEGSYGNYSASYDIPPYNYRFEGCLSDRKFVSNECSSTLMFENDGEYLTITQVNQ